MLSSFLFVLVCLFAYFVVGFLNVLDSKITSVSRGEGKASVTQITENFYAGCYINTVYFVIPSSIRQSDIISISPTAHLGDLTYRLINNENHGIVPNTLLSLDLTENTIVHVKFRPKDCQVTHSGRDSPYQLDLVSAFEVMYTDHTYECRRAKSYFKHYIPRSSFKLGSRDTDNRMFPHTDSVPATVVRDTDKPPLINTESQSETPPDTCVCKLTDTEVKVVQSNTPVVDQHAQNATHDINTQNISQSASKHDTNPTTPFEPQQDAPPDTNLTCSTTTIITTTTTNSTIVNGHTTTLSTSTNSTTTTMGPCLSSDKLSSAEPRSDEIPMVVWYIVIALGLGMVCAVYVLAVMDF